MSEARSSDDVRSLLGAYALDAVDADERAAVEALVATDEDAARELASMLAVAASLGDAVAADPPPALRAAVLAEIVGTPQLPSAGPRHAAPAELEVPSSISETSEPELAVPSSAESAEPELALPSSATEPSQSPRHAASTEAPAPPAQVPDLESTAPVTELASRRRPRTRWLAIAAAVVIGAAIPTALAVQQAQRADHAEEQQQALADLLTDPSAVVVHGTMPGGGAATAVMTDSQALISASDMPDPGTGHVYQLWVVSDGKAASAGILADSGGSAKALTDDFAPGDSLAVTVEPTGGSTQPTTDPVLVLSAT